MNYSNKRRCAIFADDIALVKELVAKYGPAPQPIVDVGGLSNPCVADYQRTIDAMAKLRARLAPSIALDPTPDQVRAAQMCRYLDIERPLSFLGDYVIENPETGGLPLERLAERYGVGACPRIGTAILLSVLEHVADPFHAIDCLWQAMAPGGIVIVSVPWAFPTHYGPEDNWRISESGLRHIFTVPAGEPAQWTILESGHRLNIPAEAGILDGDGRAQIVQSAFICARAV